jgi:steroid 5-alpha reductase family enzyme
MRVASRILLATGSIAILHSVLASRSAKRSAARLFGEENRNVYYRPFYILQSVLTFGALLLYIEKLPDRTLWKMNRTGATICNGIRLASLWEMIQAIRQIGTERLTGVAGCLAHRRGVHNVSPEPEAQGPALDRGRTITGPFRWSRHPLNFLALPVIWLAPHMTRNWFVFNCAATAYFFLGSMHEEQRLRLEYGEVYEGYRRHTRFFLGRNQSADGAETHRKIARLSRKADES